MKHRSKIKKSRSRRKAGSNFARSSFSKYWEFPYILKSVRDVHSSKSELRMAFFEISWNLAKSPFFFGGKFSKNAFPTRILMKFSRNVSFVKYNDPVKISSRMLNPDRFEDFPSYREIPNLCWIVTAQKCSRFFLFKYLIVFLDLCYKWYQEDLRKIEQLNLRLSPSATGKHNLQGRRAVSWDCFHCLLSWFYPLFFFPFFR